MDDNEVTGALGSGQAGRPVPTETDLGFARTAASDTRNNFEFSSTVDSNAASGFSSH